MEYVDFPLEEWYDLRDYEDHAGDLNGFSDEAESVRWNIPPGRYGVLYKDEDYTGDSYLLDGSGAAMSIANLATYGFGDEVTSVRFRDRNPNMWVATSSACPVPGGAGTPICPYHGTTSIQYAADRIGGPPCFDTQVVYIGGGTYNQHVYIDRPMVLAADGGSAIIVGQ